MRNDKGQESHQMQPRKPGMATPDPLARGSRGKGLVRISHRRDHPGWQAHSCKMQWKLKLISQESISSFVLKEQTVVQKCIKSQSCGLILHWGSQGGEAASWLLCG